MNALITFLQTNTTLVISICAVLVFFLFIMLYVVSFFLGKPFNIALGPFKFTTENKASCPYSEVCKQIKTFVDFYDPSTYNKSLIEIIVTETIKISEDKDRLCFKESVAHRMIKSEEYNLKIKSLLTETYATLLRKKVSKTEDVKLNKDYKYYQILITTILDELSRHSLKQSLENTDLITLSESEFESFRNQKSEIMFMIIVEYLDLMYNSTATITRDEIHNLHLDLKEKIIILYKEMYREIKEIMIQDDKIITELHESIIKAAETNRQKQLAEDPLLKIKKTLDLHMK